MSLLEDVFLQDEANEAEQLERVIEGDEFEERRRSDSDENSEKEDEAEEDKRRVDPTKPKTTRVVRNPRFLLNPARLTGSRGIQVIPEHYKDFKFKGKGHEKEDLDVVLKRLEHWAYRLYPKFQFADCLKKIEMLGKKRPVAVHLHKIRSDQFLSEDTVVQKDSSDEETPMPVQEEDEFDKLLQQQIELARSTPVPDLTKKPDYANSVSPKDKRTTSLMMPKATSSPSINEEQRERMLRSRRLAEEKRLARVKQAEIADSTETSSDSRSVNTNLYRTDKNNKSNMELIEEINEDSNRMVIGKKNNRLNTIDSSDEETVEDTFVSVSADIHTANKVAEESYMVENEKSMHIINIVNDSHKGILEIENDTEENFVSDSNSGKNDGNELITENEITEKEIDVTENNISLENNEVNSNNIHEKLDVSEELTYNKSDMDTDLNEQNISETNKENVINSTKASESEENNIDPNDLEITKVIDKEALCSSETGNVENDKFISVSKGNISNVMEDVSDNTNVPEQIGEDIMEVDFSEDF